VKTRKPLSRERKMAEAMIKRIDTYISKQGQTDNTYIELEGILRRVVKEFGVKVAKYRYSKNK